MSKSAVAAGQLSLWDMVEQDVKPAQDDDLTTRGPFAEMPAYYVKSHFWADGDTSPAALERLSHVLLGKGDTFTRSDTKEKYNYRAETTAVIGSKVWVAWRLDKSFRDLFGQALGDDEC